MYSWRVFPGLGPQENTHAGCPILTGAWPPMAIPPKSMRTQWQIFGDLWRFADRNARSAPCLGSSRGILHPRTPGLTPRRLPPEGEGAKKTNGRLNLSAGRLKARVSQLLFYPSRGSTAKGYAGFGDELVRRGLVWNSLDGVSAPKLARRWRVRPILCGRRSTSSSVRRAGPRRTAS